MLTQSFSLVWLFATTRTLACQAPLFMEFSRQEYWHELPFPSPGDLPIQGLNVSPRTGSEFFATEPPGKPGSHKAPEKQHRVCRHSTRLGWSLTSESQCLSQLGSCPNLVPTSPGQAGAHLRAACECRQGQSSHTHVLTVTYAPSRGHPRSQPATDPLSPQPPPSRGVRTETP